MTLNQNTHTDILASFEAFKVESKKVNGGYPAWGIPRIDASGDTWKMYYEYDDDTHELTDMSDIKTGTGDRG